jgi:hypothetical protein
MNHAFITAFLERLDGALSAPTVLHIYGSAAFILLGEPERMSLDIDVAGPYSVADMGELQRAAASLGVPINPGEQDDRPHIEWVGPLRLCLPPPLPATDMLLWQGKKLSVKTGSAADLIASKLIRYDESDCADIQFVVRQGGVTWSDVQNAVRRLPVPFAQDALICENLNNLRTDMRMWQGEPP